MKSAAALLLNESIFFAPFCKARLWEKSDFLANKYGQNTAGKQDIAKKLHEERTLQSGKSLPDDQKAAIIKLFFENKRKYYRQYEDEKQAEAATYYWTAWEIIEKLKLNAPIVRLSLALGEDTLEVYDKAILSGQCSLRKAAEKDAGSV